MGPREPERYFLRFIFFKPSSKNSKREKKANNNQKLESSSPFTLLPEWNLRRCTKNVKNEQIRKECFHPSGARRTLQEAIFKMFGIDHVALDPQSNRSCPHPWMQNCPRKYPGQKGPPFCFCLRSRGRHARGISVACVCHFWASWFCVFKPHFWLRLIQRTKFLTTKDVLCQA